MPISLSKLLFILTAICNASCFRVNAAVKSGLFADFHRYDSAPKSQNFHVEAYWMDEGPRTPAVMPRFRSRPLKAYQVAQLRELILAFQRGLEDGVSLPPSSAAPSPPATSAPNPSTTRTPSPPQGHPWRPPRLVHA